ncbi:MAG: trypsin-like peptidase domain-containing protein, partial [Pseudomonadota bacterium]
MRLILGAFFVCLLVVARPSQAQMTPETAARVISATLTLRSASGKEEFLGSGFLFGAADRAITAAHVVGRQRHILVITHDGRRVRATVIAIDEARDLALLQLEVPLGTPLEAGETPRIGEVVYAAGAPLEAGFTLTSGIVSAVGRQIDPTQPVAYLQHAAAVNPGSSGGPLVDEMGRVVGINARIADGSRYFVGIAYAVPLSDIADFAVNGPLEERAAPGMMLRPMDPRARRALGHEGPGVLVEHVDTSSPAARAGLEAGDILVSADGAPIVNPGDFAFAVARCGGKMVVVVIRGGEQLEMELDLT